MAPSRKRLTDTVKLVAYRAETAMSEILRDDLRREDDSRSLLRDLFRSDADVILDLHPIVRPHAYARRAAPERAAAHTVRARQLDEARTRFHNRLHDALYYPLGASSPQ